MIHATYLGKSVPTRFEQGNALTPFLVSTVLNAALAAHPAPPRHQDGLVRLMPVDPEAVALSEHPILAWVVLPFTNVPAMVCQGLAGAMEEQMRSAGAEATARCVRTTLAEPSTWTRVDPTTPDLVPSLVPPDDYWVVEVDLTDPEGLARQVKGRATVAFAKVLGVSIRGRANAEFAATAAAAFRTSGHPMLFTITDAPGRQ